MNQDLEARLAEILKTTNGLERMQKITTLRDSHPHEALEAVIRLMHSPDRTLRRLAGSSLSWFREFAGTKAAKLVDMLQHHEDERVRLSCAIYLMQVRNPVVDAAFLRALNDPFVRVAQIACVEVGARAGAQAAEALFKTMDHASWRVRLEACKALITLKKADARVVSALEAMSREPEAAVYDAECDEWGLDMEALMAFGEASGILPKTEKDRLSTQAPPELWGKLSTIIARARHIAATLP